MSNLILVISFMMITNSSSENHRAIATEKNYFDLKEEIKSFREVYITFSFTAGQCLFNGMVVWDNECISNFYATIYISSPCIPGQIKGKSRIRPVTSSSYREFCYEASSREFFL